MSTSFTYYSLRNFNLFYIPLTRTVAYYNSSLPVTVKSWNTLPDNVKPARSLDKLKQVSNGLIFSVHL